MKPLRRASKQVVQEREPENVVGELFHSPFPLSGGLQPSNAKRSVWPDRRKLLRGSNLCSSLIFGKTPVGEGLASAHVA